MSWAHLISLNDLKVNEKLKKLLVFFYKKTEIGEILHVEVNAHLTPKLKLNNAEETNLIPIVWGKDHDDRHFDIQHFNCLKWSRENLDDFRKALQNRIENTMGRGAYYKETY